MWPRGGFPDPEQIKILQQHAERARPALEAMHGSAAIQQLAKSRPNLERLLANRPSPAQMEAMTRAAKAASRIDPDFIRALNERATTRSVMQNVALLQQSLGPDGFAAAQVAASHILSDRLRTSYGGSDESATSPGEHVSGERLREVEALAGSEDVGQIVADLESSSIVEEAEAILRAEDPPELVLDDTLEIESVDDLEEALEESDSGTITASTLIGAFLILYVALQLTSATMPEQAAMLRQALEDISIILTPLLAARQLSAELENRSQETVTQRPDGEGADSRGADTQHASTSAGIELIDELLSEDPAYDRETWPGIKQALEENRLSGRKLFAN